MTTTIHFSGLNTRPGFSFRPALHSGCPVCTWTSLPSRWLTFTRVGLSLSAITHWITITNFIPIYAGSQGFGLTSARAALGYALSTHYSLRTQRRKNPETKGVCVCPYRYSLCREYSNRFLIISSKPFYSITISRNRFYQPNVLCIPIGIIIIFYFQTILKTTKRCFYVFITFKPICYS